MELTTKKDRQKKYAADFVKYKNFYEVVVDGKSLGILSPSKSTEAELARLNGLAGIDIRPASREMLISVNAKVDIPKRLLNYWQSQYRKREKDKKTPVTS